MNNNEYVRLSLELHLFFDRIMKEHSLFLAAAFTEKESNLKQTASEFSKLFSDILKETIYLSDGLVSQKVLTSGEIVTKNTIYAETKTNNLLSGSIDTTISAKELALKPGNVNANETLIKKVNFLNQKTMPIVKKLIEFKNHVLNHVLECKMYTFNYPLLISHIINEAKMYLLLLTKLESKAKLSAKEILEQELFWNKIMMEHAEFIRGLLDPSEKTLIDSADMYAKEYQNIINNYQNMPNYLSKTSLTETINFRNFKVAGEEGILNCKVKSIIIPLLADHVVREANHFIRLLEEFN